MLIRMVEKLGAFPYKGLTCGLSRPETASVCRKFEYPVTPAGLKNVSAGDYEALNLAASSEPLVTLPLL